LSPLVFWRKEYRSDSGGPGETRGGLGQTIEIQNGDDAPMILEASFDRIKYPARGALGGLDGGAGSVRLASGKALAGKGRQLVPKGDRVVIETPGGAGYGDPRSRPRAAVEADLEAGLVSLAAARQVYGYEPQEEPVRARRGGAKKPAAPR
jgi:N-methylhydantoinase B